MASRLAFRGFLFGWDAERSRSHSLSNNSRGVISRMSQSPKATSALGKLTPFS
nr:MAG TPA: hypothetical protein [Caudoviricetes sp.]